MTKIDLKQEQYYREKSARFIMMTAFIFCFLFLPSTGRAGVILDAEVRLTYEDNVVGILSDQYTGQSGLGGWLRSAEVMQAGGLGGFGGGNIYSGTTTTASGPTGDFSGTVSAAIGGYADVFSASTLFLKGFVEHTSYDTYQELDATIGGVSTGITTQLSKNITARLSVSGKIKRFQDNLRSGNSSGGKIGLRENFTRDLWLRQFAEYEKHNADSPLFGYTGTKVGISAGYDLTNVTIATVGYSYLAQAFEEPSGTLLRTGTSFLTIEQAMSRAWFFSVEYDLQASRDSTSGTKVTNNLYSLSLRYSY